jgi:hypothetical protein
MVAESYVNCQGDFSGNFMSWVGCHAYVVKAGKKRPHPVGCRRFFRILALLAEGLAVGAFDHGGVQLVGAHGDALQRAVVLGVTVVGALGDGTRNALVSITETVAHGSFLLCHWHGNRIPAGRRIMRL